jgi:putative hydrolase of the HAD superfamily
LSQIENKEYEDTKVYYEDLIYNKLFSLTPKAKTKVKFTIKTLREMGYILGILTEFPYETKLKKLGIPQSDFEIIINLEDYGILKPQEECFSMLIRTSNLRPDEIVYVGDRLDTDVMGANGSGIRSCIVSRRKVKQADYTIRCLPDIMTVVERVS